MEEESKDLIRESNDLLISKRSVKIEWQDFKQELGYYGNLDCSKIDYKEKLEDLKNQCIVDDNYKIK